MTERILVATLSGDRHTQGIFNFTRLAREAGYQVTALPPGAGADEILAAIQAQDPDHLGFSYRLSPKVGLEQLTALLGRLEAHGLLKRSNGQPRRLAFAGLPETVKLVREALSRYEITCLQQSIDPLDAVNEALDYLGVRDERRARILTAARARLLPPRSALLDQLADEVMADASLEPPLDVPSDAARRSYVARLRECRPNAPLLRTHYGEPGETIDPTVEGIRQLAEAQVIDELSLGSSDLSQRYYNEPARWAGQKNDGGVPYRCFDDLVRLKQAAERGNFPAVKPYSHVVNLEWFVDECLRAGMLTGAHQAVPLYWFNQLDGRGPSTVAESLAEHARTVARLSQRGIPVEMNDPNHWSSRWAPDAVVVADYGVIASVMLANGVTDLVFQMQFNKPKETSDAGDLAKFRAARQLIDLMTAGRPVKAWIETRTGIDHFEPDLAIARKQLARSTLLQMALDPDAIHLVSFCEALYVAKPADIIESSGLIRKAVKVWRRHRAEGEKAAATSEILARQERLLKEALFLLEEIARLNPRYRPGAKPAELVPFIADPATLHAALERGIMAAPGIFTEPFRRQAARTFTDIFPGGFIDSMDPDTLQPISEAARLARQAG